MKALFSLLLILLLAISGHAGAGFLDPGISPTFCRQVSGPGSSLWR